jgi:transposase
MLKYKAAWNNRKIIEVGSFYPSSKTCHCCGYIKRDLTLNDRVWYCPECKTKHDRDINAAINIKNEGLRIMYNVKQSTERIAETEDFYSSMLVENPTMDDKSAMTLKSSDSMKQEFL